MSNLGVLYRFSLLIEDGKITKLELREKNFLRNKNGEVFKKKKRDAEGMACYRDGFLIAFERKHRILYCSRKGKKFQKITLPKPLQNKKHFRSANKGLESVLYSKKYGILTIPELPLKGRDEDFHTLYGMHTLWHFKAKGSVSGMSWIDDEHILLLLRSYSYISQRRVIELRSLSLDECDSKRLCKTKTVARLDSSDGWKLDNFEGICRVGERRYLMVSDDNDSFFQKTLLVLFEIRR